MSGPLAGVRIVEFEGIGPGPLAGRLLADMGAELTVIARPGKGAVSERFHSGNDDARAGQYDAATWPPLKAHLTARGIYSTAANGAVRAAAAPRLRPLP